jgi:cystathionine gamma-synthase
MKFETLAVHAGRTIDGQTASIAPPIYLSTTFEREADGSFRGGTPYARDANPNRREIEACIAALEGGADAAAFASGMAAIAAIFHALAPGDHVIVAHDAYYGVRLLLDGALARWGLATSYVDLRDLSAVKAAMCATTRLIFIESPSNPLVAITDIASVAAIARNGGAHVACDNTWATPVLQRPLDLGADLIVHSGTKYLGGHSDTMLGLIVTRDASDALFARVREAQSIAGAIPSPFACWLALRGADTLALRVREQSRNALAIATFLRDHPAVTAVHYAGLPSDPGHAVAARQMHGGFGGVLSFEVRGGRDAAMRVASGVSLFVRATSFGGTHSAIEHRRSVEGERSITPEGLLRAAIGVEHADDLICDLERALDRA